MKKFIIGFFDVKREYTYSNKIQNENKPYTKKILFKTKKKIQQKNVQDKSKIYLSLTSILIKLINDLIKKKKNEAFDKIKKRYILEKLFDTLKKYVYRTYYEELFERLQILIDMYENDGPQQARLFKLIRKSIIKKLFIYKEKVYKINKLFYLINLTIFSKELAKNRWIRQVIRKWRFITFMKKMTRKKMQDMYKNMHISYLEMINTIFSDEEKINPSVVKEFERFGYNVGMFINEDPFLSQEEKLHLKVKKQYLFQPIDIEKEGDVKIKKTIVEKEMKKEETYFGEIKRKNDMDKEFGHKKYEAGESIENDNDNNNTGIRYEYKTSSFKKEEDKSKSKNESKTGSKLKVHVSNKPSYENEEKYMEKYEKEKNM